MTEPSTGLFHPLQFICPGCKSAITVEARCSVCGAGLCSQAQFTHTRKRNVPLFLVGPHSCRGNMTPEEIERLEYGMKMSSAAHRASTRAEE